MKNLIITFSTLLSILFVTNSFAQEQAPTAGAEITFEKTVHDYGTVEYGGNGVCTFKFTNTGTEPLVITSAKGSCGCTVPQWPREPIAPGASAEIKVKYDTKRPGTISKSVTIQSNATNSPTTVVRIKGTVKAKPASQVPVAAPSPIEN